MTGAKCRYRPIFSNGGPRFPKNKAKEIKRNLQQLGLGKITYEDTGNIGKGYRRHDEIGTPLCLTVDFQTIEDNSSVTARDRDTMKQERISIEALPAYLRSKLT